MSELSTGKSIVVVAIVVGCFAVLWPKIFYPMFFGSTFDGRKLPDRQRPDRPLHMNPEMLHPAMRDRNPGRAMPFAESDASVLKRTVDKEIRPGPVPGMRPAMGGPGIQPQVQPRQGQGAMGMLMPLYTVGIVIFFLYTVMKLVFRKDGQESSPETYTSARKTSRGYQSQHETELIEQLMKAKQREQQQQQEMDAFNAYQQELYRSQVKQTSKRSTESSPQLDPVTEDPVEEKVKESVEETKIEELNEPESKDDESMEEKEDAKEPQEQVPEETSEDSKTEAADEMKEIKDRLEATETVMKDLQSQMALLIKLASAQKSEQKDSL